YNEQDNVVRTTMAVLRACERLACDFEVIIVNDGSTDRTAELAEQLARQHPQVRVVHNWPNRGYGAALRRGFYAAVKNWVFYTDGDGQFDPGELQLLLPLLRHCQIVSAYRIRRSDPLLRRVNAWAWTMLVNLLFGMRLRDVDCAFKIFPKALFEQIELHSNGALIDAEVLAKARLRGYRVAQVGVHHYPRLAGQQTGAKLPVVLRAFWELFRLYGDIRLGARSVGRRRQEAAG
ncbi:MAG: glycosyltransferase family 2 protein, partial [Phycisphaerae bacterium]